MFEPVVCVREMPNRMNNCERELVSEKFTSTKIILFKPLYLFCFLLRVLGIQTIGSYTSIGARTKGQTTKCVFWHCHGASSCQFILWGVIKNSNYSDGSITLKKIPVKLTGNPPNTHFVTILMKLKVHSSILFGESHN